MFINTGRADRAARHGWTYGFGFRFDFGFGLSFGFREVKKSSLCKKIEKSKEHARKGNRGGKGVIIVLGEERTHI